MVPYTLYLVLCTWLQAVCADVQLINPASAASIAGGTVILKWQDSGRAPALSSIKVADIILCTGTNAAPTTLYTLAGAVAIGTTSQVSVTIPLTIGTSGQYFIKFVSTTTAGAVVITYSDRFKLTGMTGTAAAGSNLPVAGPSGTTPAAASMTTTSGARVISITNAAAAAGYPDLSQYIGQTGLTRQAPPQAKPGSKITADPKRAQPLYPASSYSVFTTYYAAPDAQTTVTAAQTYTPLHYANAAVPAQFVANAYV